RARNRTKATKGGYLSWVSITTLTALASLDTGTLVPCRSPGWAIAVPLFDTRAATTTFGKAESFIAGVIAIESSSWKRYGRSRTRVRATASGIGGPSTARAKTNTVSSGAAFSFSFGDSDTVPRKEVPDFSPESDLASLTFC